MRELSVSPEAPARKPINLKPIFVGVVAILVLAAGPSIGRGPTSGLGDSTGTGSSTITADPSIFSLPNGLTLSATAAASLARARVFPDAVLQSATQGTFATTYVPPADNAGLTGSVPGDAQVWVFVFSENIVICPPPYLENGQTVEKPCLASRPATVAVVLDAKTGELLGMDGFSPKP